MARASRALNAALTKAALSPEVMAALMPEMTLSEARALLRVGPSPNEEQLRRAFREAVKSAHPDRPGGAPERFRRVVAAYGLLQEAAPEILAPSPAPIFRPGRIVPARRLAITPLIAWAGGSTERVTGDGRTLRIRLPPGLRAGDVIRADEEKLEIEVTAEPGMQVRGHDLWLTVEAPARTLQDGGSLAVNTPFGRRVLWVTKKAGERRLLRAPDLGLPARGRHPQGHLFVRLTPKTGTLDSAARALLRRFAADWAA